MLINRVRVVQLIFGLALILVIFRLFYWQVLAGETLKALGANQYQSTQSLQAERGRILSQDNFPLVDNQPAYLVFAYRPDLKLDFPTFADRLAPILQPVIAQNQASQSADLSIYTPAIIKDEFITRYARSTSSWIPLARKVPESIKIQLESLNLNGLGFDPDTLRLYPESSMAANLLGFVGSDGAGNPKGYFGLEGYYNLELTGRPGVISQEKDVHGRPIAIGDFATSKTQAGRTLHTSLDRSLQLLAETYLDQGLARYQSQAGEVVIMDTQTGHILAMAQRPTYDPAHYRWFPAENYRTSFISDTYEPGSTFKTIVMAIGLDTGVITPESICQEACQGPITLGEYQIKTWNNQYFPGQTTTQILERSDNVGMVYIAGLIGEARLVNALKRFGFGSLTGIDLEGESIAPLRSRWAEIDLATSSFGQGIAVTSIQMLTAVNALANNGLLVKPSVVVSVSENSRTIPIKTPPPKRVISPEAAASIKQMMIQSALHGEAKWLLPQGYTVAGKTGTAQIPLKGHYDAEKTIASFIGFAPAENPRFTMLVKLKEPQASPWASETAAPLWFALATQVLRQLGIAPTQPMYNN